MLAFSTCPFPCISKHCFYCRCCDKDSCIREKGNVMVFPTLILLCARAQWAPPPLDYTRGGYTTKWNVSQNSLTLAVYSYSCWSVPRYGPLVTGTVENVKGLQAWMSSHFCSTENYNPSVAVAAGAHSFFNHIFM